MSKSIHSKEYKFVLAQLKNARLEAGLTQEEVAKRIGKPQSYISKCESGERRLDVTELNEQARLLQEIVFNEPFSSPTIFGIYSLTEAVFVLSRNQHPIYFSHLPSIFSLQYLVLYL